MSSDVEEYYSKPRGVLALWFGLLAGPIALLLNLSINYMLLPWICSGGSASVLYLISLVMFVVALLGAMTAWNSWDRLGRRWPDGEGGVDARSRFMAAGGLLVSGLFILALIAQAIPIFIVPPCEQ